MSDQEFDEPVHDGTPAAMPTPARMHAVLTAFLRDLGVQENLVELQVLEFRRELTNETDRGAALYASAHLDERLAILLRTFFVQDESVTAPLFSGSGAFATFSARIDTTYLLGLIPAAVRRDLHLIRKIRNEFAHSTHPVRFTDQAIAARCQELTNAPLADRPRSKFFQAVMGLAGVVDAKIRLLSEGRQPRCLQAREITPADGGTAKMAVQLLVESLEQEPKTDTKS